MNNTRIVSNATGNVFASNAWGTGFFEFGIFNHSLKSFFIFMFSALTKEGFPVKGGGGGTL